jgi:hypothetical protein
MFEGIPGLLCCSVNEGFLEGADDSDAKGCVTTFRPMADINICWAAIIPRDDATLFSDR